MNFSCRFIVLLFIYINAFSVSATSISFIKPSEVSDKDALDWSTDVIEGKVIEVVQLNQKFINPCFQNVYKLLISEVLKGTKKVGSEIMIGLTSYSPKILIGQKYLAVVGIPFSGFYKTCGSGDLFSNVKVEDMKVEHGQKSSIYRIEEKLFDGIKIFSLLRCGNDGVFFKEKSSLFVKHSEFGEGMLKCDIYKGRYSILKKSFERLIDSSKKEQN